MVRHPDAFAISEGPPSLRVHFLEGSASPHIERQQSFLAGVDFATPFSIKEYEPLLRMDAA